jgi:hypothetical protein
LRLSSESPRPLRLVTSMRQSCKAICQHLKVASTSRQVTFATTGRP